MIRSLSGTSGWHLIIRQHIRSKDISPRPLTAGKSQFSNVLLRLSLSEGSANSSLISLNKAINIIIPFLTNGGKTYP